MARELICLLIKWNENTYFDFRCNFSINRLFLSSFRFSNNRINITNFNNNLLDKYELLLHACNKSNNNKYLLTLKLVKINTKTLKLEINNNQASSNRETEDLPSSGSYYWSLCRQRVSVHCILLQAATRDRRCSRRMPNRHHAERGTAPCTR